MRIPHCLAVALLGSLILGDGARAAEALIGAPPRAGIPGAAGTPGLDLDGLATRGFDTRAIADALDRLGRAEPLALRGRTEARVFEKIAPRVVLVVTPEAIGSGSVVAANGLVLTNWHVIEGHEQVAVVPYVGPDRSPGPKDVVPALVVKIDQVADLALLKVTGRVPASAKPVQLSANEDVRVGEDVHAIGHPEGQFWTYTGGFVSQVRPGYQWTSRGLIHQATAIQTQTPINPGNSGGPLLDDKARLIGVNTFKAPGAEGLNYAVSVDDVKRFLYRRGDRMAEPAPVARHDCEPHVMYSGRTELDDGDMETYDLDCDGTEDAVIVEYDDGTRPTQLFLDIDDQGVPGGVVLDNDRDGHWDVSYWDTDRDGTTDLVGYHPDGGFEPSDYAPYKSEG